jgi:serine-type anaerobic sulfatase-maturating enzyme
VRFACHGGCPKDRFLEDPYGDPGLNYLCAGYKAFFGHVTGPMRHMESLLRTNHAAAEVMRVYAMEDSARGRDEPCSCGSGRTFKVCHGDEPLPTEEALEAAISAVS